MADLMDKKIEDLTPQELAQLQSKLAATMEALNNRQKAIKDTVEKSEFAKIEAAYSEAAKALGWLKPPKIQIFGEDFEHVKAEYITAKGKAKSGNGTGRKVSPDTGKITVNKIATVMGGIKTLEVGGVTAETPKELVKLLKQADGKLESEHCWELTGKGITASAIITSPAHAKEVTLTFNDGTKMTVEEAIAKLEEARKEPKI